MTFLTIAIISRNQSQGTSSGTLSVFMINKQSLVDDGKVLYESSIIVEYLNDQYDLSLFPKDPYQRAKGKIVVDVINKKIIPAYFRTMQAQEPDKQVSAREEFTAALKEFGSHLPKDDGPYYSGKNFGFVDIELVPWVLR
jgi:glutathione S-transferase